MSFASFVVVKSQLDVQPVKSDGRYRKKNLVASEEFEVDEAIDRQRRSSGANETETVCEPESQVRWTHGLHYVIGGSPLPHTALIF